MMTAAEKLIAELEASIRESRRASERFRREVLERRP